jgi:hypothetical protein
MAVAEVEGGRLRLGLQCCQPCTLTCASRRRIQAPHLVHLSNQLGVALAEIASVVRGGFDGSIAIVVHLAMLIQIVDGIAFEARAPTTAPVAVSACVPAV